LSDNLSLIISIGRVKQFIKIFDILIKDTMGGVYYFAEKKLHWYIAICK
jgi:hypothetical protein